MNSLNNIYCSATRASHDMRVISFYNPTNSTVHDVSIEILNISAFPFKDRISFGPYGQIPPHTRSEGCFQMLDQDPKYLELLIKWRDQFGQIYESQQVIPL